MNCCDGANGWGVGAYFALRLPKEFLGEASHICQSCENSSTGAMPQRMINTAGTSYNQWTVLWERALMEIPIKNYDSADENRTECYQKMQCVMV